MQHGIGWTALLGLALGATACAYGVVDEPDDDDDAATSAVYDSSTSTGTHSDQTGSTSTGTATAPSGGVCYWGGGECNPMWTDCDLGETCDAAEGEGFVCHPPPNDADLGCSCDVVLGPYCSAGSTCVDGVCRAFCCAAGDCGLGSCQNAGFAGTLALKVCLP